MRHDGESAVDAVLGFLDRINQHDADKLAEYMTQDHVFIDSLGQSVSGREKMRSGWRGYFAFCPDYWVSHEEIFPSGQRVAVFGAAGGTLAADGQLPPQNRWRASAAWLALVKAVSSSNGGSTPTTSRSMTSWPDPNRTRRQWIWRPSGDRLRFMKSHGNHQ